MRMHLAVSGVNHEPFKVRLDDERLKQALPNAFVSPPAEPTMGVLPVAIARREVSPRRACAQNPDHCVDKASIVMRDTAHCPLCPNKFLKGWADQGGVLFACQIALFYPTTFD